jgi:hypothetical protein
MRSRTLFFLLALAGILAPAQWLTQRMPGIPRSADGKANLNAPTPRAADGRPDLSGPWTRLSPRYRHNIAADLKPEDVPAWVQTLVKQRTENLSKESMSAQCLPAGPAYVTDADSNGGGMMKIVQTPSLIVILNADLTYRQVYLDGRALEPSPSPSYMGYSVGRWEADSLVVESFGFKDKTWLDENGHPHSEKLRTLERYRRPDFGHLDIQMTIEDPEIYPKPWTVAVKAEFAADTELLEYVCNENDKGHEHWVGKDSDQKLSQVKVAPEILSKYAGTYVEQPKFWRLKARTAVITFGAGTLYGSLEGREKEEQYARSEKTFSGFSGLAIEFIKDERGEVTGLFVKHVSGDYRFARQN